MLESVLADVLTRILGQYLEGIDRDSVRFGAWSGLVELRGVALRPEALAVLFETLGMDLPVTVEAGFIGLLRLQVPWNAIGTTPVQIHMNDITIMARPVRGDGSDDSELKTRERRIKRARLNTDDAVREASWGVSGPEVSSSSSWGTWLVSEELRAKIIDNIQIHLSDILIRFEDPFSDPRRPYVASIVCKSLNVVSANEFWKETFVERSAETPHTYTRKLLEVKGFQVDWAPITPRDAPGLSSGTSLEVGADTKRFETLESLKRFMTEDGSSEGDSERSSRTRHLVHPVDGSMRLCLSASTNSAKSSEADASVDLDIRFPHIVVDLDDVQYACILQTSVYFARLATRGFRPTTPRARWVWAVNQLLPGFSARRVRALRFNEQGILEARDRRVLYGAYRKSVLKARRMGVPEPKNIAEDLEKMEDSLSYEEVTAMRDYVDRQIEIEGEDWSASPMKSLPAKDESTKGTTVSTFWQMLGYKEENETHSESSEGLSSASLSREVPPITPERPGPRRGDESTHSLALRASFLLQSASIRLSQHGFPKLPVPRVALDLHDLRCGLLYSNEKGLTVEALLGSIEAWDLLSRKRMVYNKMSLSSDLAYDEPLDEAQSAYPNEVSDAIDSIRRGLNPAKELLGHQIESDEEEQVHVPGEQYFNDFQEGVASQDWNDDAHRQSHRDRPRETSDSWESTPNSTFQVTESEFFGNAATVPASQKYIAAFRYVQVKSGDGESLHQSTSKLDVSIATLEAIVDGPKGSFVWGLKFWQPKGMAQDPIMAFLGAAAGARIAELRMEMKEALLASKVPMQVNAVILAPRFIFPSSSATPGAIVVNMGTLGICTSDNALHFQAMSSAERDRRRLRYSNYVLTLDDLGVYFSPSADKAVSPGCSQSILQLDNGAQNTEDGGQVERIIRPFSLRFILQTLRDASVVQVAHASTAEEADVDKIAKVRVRGDIPGLYVILSRVALQHLVVEGRLWASQLRPSVAVQKSQQSPFPSQDNGWVRAAHGYDTNLLPLSSIGSGHGAEERLQVESSSFRDAVPSILASYDIKVMLQKVSVELRESMDVRLVTAVASRMCAKVVKKSKTELHSNFSLKSWSVTDASRGRTAAFRGLVYAGSFVGPKGVSPPRSLTGTGEDFARASEDDKDFIDIQYAVDFASNERTIRFQVLSLNMMFVRETYVRLALFFSDIRKRAKAAFEERKDGNVSVSASSMTEDSAQGGPEDRVDSERVPTIRTSITAEFDGFNIQLIAAGGAVASVEMKESRIQFLREQNSEMKMWGDFKGFNVCDCTAPISEHASVVSYYKQARTRSEAKSLSESIDDVNGESIGDRWTLSFPSENNGQYRFQAQFEGLNVCFLYRFSVVIDQYFSVLHDVIDPIVAEMLELYASEDQESAALQYSPRTVRNHRRPCVDIDLRDFRVRLPRHSECASELMIIDVSKIHIRNFGEEESSAAWHTSIDGVNFAVEYTIPSSSDPSNVHVASAPFLNDFSAELMFERGLPARTTHQDDKADDVLLVEIHVMKDVLLELCEAQYTVLYFILTENLAETICGIEVAADLGEAESGTPSPFEPTQDDKTSERSQGPEFEDFVALDGSAPKARRTVLNINLLFSAMNIELSRGWNVSDKVCKVVGFYLEDLRLNFIYQTPSRILYEVSGTLHSGADLRPEGPERFSPFAVPLEALIHSSGTDAPRKENVTMTYEREAGSAAIMVVSLNELQLEIAPELFRDLSYMAVPGWPYLRSSPDPPDFVYLGRSLTVITTKSQVLLRSDEFEADRRAVVWTGEHQLKVEWMRGTGAKRIALRSTHLEVAATFHFPPPHVRASSDRPSAYSAAAFEKTGTPLLYPTDFAIEYVGPNVDDSGCRLQMTAESMLCLINAAEISLIRAVVSRPARLTPSYLSQRDWVQASILGQQLQGSLQNPKEERMRKALENMSVSVKVPAARYLLTDNVDGRFVPVLETCVSSLEVSAHLGNMVQVDGEIALDLFNKVNGSWEPALEPWHLAASISWGQSGTRAIVLKSEGRLNVNVAPTSVAAASTVRKAMKTATNKAQFTTSLGGASPRIEHDKDSFSPDAISSAAVRRPTVAAFLVRNELGFPVSMSLLGSSRKITVAHNTEIEVGAQTEELVSAAATGKKTREEALKCIIAIPGFVAQELSASDIGKQYISFRPNDDLSSTREEFVTSVDLEGSSISAIWEVEMMNGVPVCILRSLLRIKNEMGAAMEILFSTAPGKVSEGTSQDDHRALLDSGGSLSVPVDLVGASIQIRPSAADFFEWSSSLPRLPWLYQNARQLEAVPMQKSSKPSQAAHTPSRATVIKCGAAQGGSSDFFVRVDSAIPNIHSSRFALMSSWIDVCLRAPVVLHNKLPGSLSYRITIDGTVSTSSNIHMQASGTVVAAGVIAPQEDAHLHVSSEYLSSLRLSLAYDNYIAEDSTPSNSPAPEAAFSRSAPARFGPELSLDALVMKRTAAVLPSPNRGLDVRGPSRKEFRATVLPRAKGEPFFDIYAGFWIRNRSDSALEVCSRNSYYGSGSQPIYLREKPPLSDPDPYVCLEGPYISVRLPKLQNQGGRSDLPDHSEWWTTPSVLEDIDKPFEANLRGRSLEIDVRPAAGMEGRTFIVTIRNSSWICNNTMSTLQWCQSSALDAHGNCITRLLNSLQPGQTQAIHWEEKSAERAVHLRLSENGQSDWIWSPAIPLNIGHSRELPAKMYRPKTHEQYIARVASKELVGGSRALAVYAEDKQHPPYRIVNLCTERAVAFSQIGSQERPWLVRAGRTTRYSWDNPLARPSERLLSIRILEPDELLVRMDGRSNQAGPNTSLQQHEKCNLNIDVVGDRVMVLTGNYVPTLVVSVSVVGATKVVTFCDEDESGKMMVKESDSSRPLPSSEGSKEDLVPTVGWDDMGNRSARTSLTVGVEAEQLSLSDYPPKKSADPVPKKAATEKYDTDAAFFMDSIGISVITRDPSELMYISFKGVLINYECYNNLESASLHVRDFQVDNQLERTPYPVLMWIPSATLSVSSLPNYPLNSDNAIAIEIHREPSGDDILMIRSFQGAVRPFNVCFEDNYVSKLLGFLADTSFMDDGRGREALIGSDSDQDKLGAVLIHSNNTRDASPRQHGLSSSRRLYVHDFTVSPTALSLTSSGSGTAIAKAAGINSSARALVALLLNVENCQFSFASLNVTNVFDSLHHFAILVKEYYVTQLNSQRMNLLASNSIMGNPAALFDAVGTGARDFFSEPGRAKGSAEFIASVGRGSKSLFTHTVGGLVESVSSIPRAVSSGLEKAVGDNDYIAERERIRGSNLSGHRGSSAKNPAQGLATGAISFAHGISSGVTGLIREPVRGARQGGAGGLLKGIGKAFIGGVAKPVAGAIDLVTEPAAGLSRQITESERAGQTQLENVIPERPPRAFRGQSKRLSAYQSRESVGNWLYHAVQIASGISLESDLVEWVELSDRPGRIDPDSEAWVWSIVQQFSRSMPGAKNQLKLDSESLTGSGKRSGAPDTRPEKIRVALITTTDLLIATLDCKLVTVIPLWKNCTYNVTAQNKEVILRTKRAEDAGSYQEGSGFLFGAQALLAAPWDVNVERRKRPSPGEELVDRIPCGSVEAGVDLSQALRLVLKRIEEASLGGARKGLRGSDGSSQTGLELSSMSRLEDGWQEMSSRSRYGDLHGRNQRTSPPRLGSYPAATNPKAADASTSSGGMWGTKARALNNLQKRIRRLSTTAALRPSVTGDSSKKVIIANKLEKGRRLSLVDSSLENGTWNMSPPPAIAWYDAEAFEVSAGKKVSSRVTYRIDEADDMGTSETALADDKPQVSLEFFDGGDGSISFTTMASQGFRADFEHSHRYHGTVVFTVRQTEKDWVAKRDIDSQRTTQAGSSKDSPTQRESNRGVEGQSNQGGMSSDELSLQQLVDIGFKFEDAVVALAEAGGDMVKAVDILTR